MDLKQNYVISLERTPERLWTWMGANDALGLPHHSVTVYRGVDWKDFQNNAEIAEFLREQGLSFANTERIENMRWGPHFSNRASKWMVIKHITEQPDGWYLMWEDDVSLDVPYAVLQWMLGGVPEDIGVVSCYGHPVPTHMDIWTERTEVKGAKFLYEGFIGFGAEHCLCLRPWGAEKFLEICGEKYPANIEGLVCDLNIQPSLRTFTATVTQNYVHHGGNISGIGSCSMKLDAFEDGVERKQVFNEILENNLRKL